MHTSGMAGALAEQAAIRLRDLVKSYMAAFEEAYGKNKFRFKHHQLLHLPDQIYARKRLLICFVLERKHYLAKVALQWHKRLRAIPCLLDARWMLIALQSGGEVADSPRAHARQCSSATRTRRSTSFTLALKAGWRCRGPGSAS